MVLDEFFSFLTSPDTERRIDLGVVLARNEIESDIKDLSSQLNTIEMVETKELQINIAEQQREMRTQEEIMGELSQSNYANQSIIQQLQKQVDITQKDMTQSANLSGAIEEKKQNRDLSMLLQSNSVQDSLYYLLQLQDRISAAKKTIIDTEIQRVRAQASFDGCKEKIALLKLKLDKDIPQKKENITRHMLSLNQKMLALKIAESVLPPTASKKPVRPKRDFTIAVAALLGMLFGSALALGLEKRAGNI
jgi:LPS O-antigen subunit length determinant protein (WzzB/FepE family)